MMRRTAVGFFVALASAWTLGVGAAGDRHSFEIAEREFRLDGRPFVIRCGEMHFARVPAEYWRHRLQMVRACGFNAVCAYLFWNYHEQSEGRLDFTGDRDVARFCRIAQEEGLWVILRPGPYTCAEWEFGGHPWWLLKREGIRLRSTDLQYLEPACRYLKAVGRELAPLQVTRGGPIVMVQAENEYGSYGDDPVYMRAIYTALREAGFEVPLFCCNGRGSESRGLIPELLPVINFGSDPTAAFASMRQIAPHAPPMCGEYYPAWFDSWGQGHHVKSSEECLRDLACMLEQKVSFSMYMAHGGTSFGWWAGCNAPFVPVVSSYDYEAPVSEAGWTTTKFFEMRKLFGRHLNPGETIPEPPEAIPLQHGESELVAATGDLFAYAASTRQVRATIPLTFEQADLGYGMAVYATTVMAGAGGELKADVRDLGIVRVDGAEIGYFDRRYPRQTLAIAAADRSRKLEILVEAMGRYNFGQEMHQGMKGVIGEVTLGGRALSGWDMAFFNYDELADGVKYGAERNLANVGSTPAGSVHRLVTRMSAGRDTFLDMSVFRKGLVRVNGRWLGRYWSIGPTQTMYLPGCWLRDGDNEIVVVDTVGSRFSEGQRLRWTEHPVLDELVADNDFRKVRWNERKVGLDAWKGRKVAFLGDSITDPVHVGCTSNYWNFLIDDLGLEAKVLGKNGDTWLGVPSQVNRLHEAMVYTDVDAIFVLMGTNDYMAGVPLGEMFEYRDEETNRHGKRTVLRRRRFNYDVDTFYGRLNVAFRKLKTDFLDAQFIVMTPPHRGFFACSETNVQPPESFANPEGRFLDEYVAAIKTAAMHWSVPVIDLYAESGLIPENESYIGFFRNSKTDLLHPNTRGHRRLADLIEARLNVLPAGSRR